MSENDVRINDWKYLQMYDDFRLLRERKMKYRSVIAELSESYGVSRAQVERILRRLRRSVK